MLSAYMVVSDCPALVVLSKQLPSPCPIIYEANKGSYFHCTDQREVKSLVKQSLKEKEPGQSLHKFDPKCKIFNSVHQINFVLVLRFSP